MRNLIRILSGAQSETKTERRLAAGLDPASRPSRFQIGTPSPSKYSPGLRRFSQILIHRKSALRFWQLPAIHGALSALALLACALPPTASAQVTAVGHALFFDGTTNATAITSGFQGFPSTDITVEFWARSVDATRQGVLFSYAVAGSPNTFVIHDQGNLSVWINNATNISSGISINDGLWHHVAVT